MRKFGDHFARPQWRSFTAAVAHLLPRQEAARLWYDDRDIAFLREDQGDEAEIRGKDATTIRALVEAGFDAVNLANNHTLDYGEEPLLDTLDGLAAAGIAAFGAGRNAEAAARREEAGLTRALRPRPAASDTLDLAGNDYLGLARHPEVTEAAAGAARR